MALQQGLSGLISTTRALEVIGNNVANANTVGAKASRAEFADAYANALNTGSNINSPGIGVQVVNIAQQFTQGTINPTENPLDLAINGNGFFQLDSGPSGLVYSRNGQFRVDSSGQIVNTQGFRLLGYPGAATGGTLAPLRMPTEGSAPSATTRISPEFNLDSRLPRTEPLAAPNTINFNDPATYNSATSVTAFDAKGNPVSLTYYFQKTGTDQWNVYASANGTSLSNDAAGARPVAKFSFKSDGSGLTNNTLPLAMGDPGTITYYDAAWVNPPAATNTVGTGVIPLPTVPSVTLAAGGVSNPITGLSLDLTKVTQFGGAFGVTNIQQDGYGPGKLTGLAVEKNGSLVARFSNGRTVTTGQIELANFRNPQGLQPIGDNAWVRTAATGDPLVGVPTSGNMGALQSSALEESNVDVTRELISMITVQRSYQANAQTIKTQDAMLNTLLSIR